jgi:hypothetical protein
MVNQAMSLIILYITLPYFSAAYTLAHVYLIWAMLALYLAYDVTVEGPSVPASAIWWMLGLMAFLFTPVQYLKGRSQIYGGQFHTVALFALLAIILLFPLRSKFFDSD